MKTETPPALTSLYRNWSILFSPVECAERKIGIKRYRSEQTTTACVPTTPERKKLKNAAPEIGSGANAHDRKEKGFFDKCEPAAFLIPSKRTRTEMSELKKMTPLCSIYDVDIR